MTPDLQMLVWSAALFLVQMLVAAAGANGQVGLPALAGNREDLPPLTGWAGRARRAHANMLEISSSSPSSCSSPMSRARRMR
jgi:uncharacterized MAPEG superfamily protein